jgi:mannose-6-phosphate isomerase-like protein (cupin superfamily)
MPDDPADTPASHTIGTDVAERARALTNGHVGSTLVSETDRYRIWLIRLAPGERLAFHTHVLNYFWVATAAGRARSRTLSGETGEFDQTVGETGHRDFGPGESATHDLENIGTTVLTYTTVEDKRSPNPPLPL